MLTLLSHRTLAGNYSVHKKHTCIFSHSCLDTHKHAQARVPPFYKMFSFLYISLSLSSTQIEKTQSQVPLIFVSRFPLVSLSFLNPWHPLFLLSARCFVGTLWQATQQGLCSLLPVEECMLSFCVSPRTSPVNASPGAFSSSPLLFLILLSVYFGVSSASDPRREAS